MKHEITLLNASKFLMNYTNSLHVNVTEFLLKK